MKDLKENKVNKDLISPFLLQKMALQGLNWQMAQKLLHQEPQEAMNWQWQALREVAELERFLAAETLHATTDKIIGLSPGTSRLI